MIVPGIYDVYKEPPNQVLERYSKHVNHRFARVIELIGFNRVFTKAQGAWLWDQDGRPFLDFLGGYSVFNIGRNHPRVKQALVDWLEHDGASLVQMECSPLAGLLAENLAKLTPGDLDTVLFTNTGAEATEVGLKMARKTTRRPRILYSESAFHGLTYGAISVSDDPMWRDGFEPFLPGCQKIPFDDLEALEHELDQDDVAAFITEPIQGEAGVRLPADNYLPEAARLCRKRGALLIVDEIQTGFGRTGRWFACDHWGVEPDIMLLSKGMSGGYVPVGAVVTRRRVFDRVFEDLPHAVVHTTTFGMNAMAMISALSCIEVMKEEGVVENAASAGADLIERLDALAGLAIDQHHIRSQTEDAVEDRPEAERGFQLAILDVADGLVDARQDRVRDVVHRRDGRGGSHGRAVRVCRVVARCAARGTDQRQEQQEADDGSHGMPRGMSLLLI